MTPADQRRAFSETAQECAFGKIALTKYEAEEVGGGTMPRQIVIECDFGSDKQPPYYRVLDFNTSLFRLARGDKWMSFPLDEIDKTTGQCVHVKSARRLRRILARIEKLVEDHGLEEIVRLTVK
jgi:hypothetical protein